MYVIYGEYVSYEDYTKYTGGNRTHQSQLPTTHTRLPHELLLSMTICRIIVMYHFRQQVYRLIQSFCSPCQNGNPTISQLPHPVGSTVTQNAFYYYIISSVTLNLLEVANNN